MKLPDAEKLLNEGFKYSPISKDELEEEYSRFISQRLFIGEKHEAPMRIISPAKNSNVSIAADKFFEAGRLFSNSNQWEWALRAFHWSRRFYMMIPGKEFQEKEIKALDASAEVYLTLSELTPYSDPKKKECNIRAAEFFMRIAWLQEDLKALKDARSAYSNACHRYYLGDEMKNSAYAARDWARISDELVDHLDAAKVFILAAERLKDAEKNQLKEEIDILRKIQSDWYREAGYRFKQLGTAQDKRDAMNAFDVAATVVFSTDNPELVNVCDNYLEALELAKELRLYKELDKLHYNFQITKRKKALIDHQYLFATFSCVIDWLWGYGVKPWRLVRALMLTVVFFAPVYFITQQIQVKIKPVDPIDRVSYLLLCTGYSIYTVLPTGIIKWLTGIGLIVEFEVVGITKLVSAVEGLIGLAYISMASVLATRWVKRTILAKSE